MFSNAIIDSCGTRSETHMEFSPRQAGWRQIFLGLLSPFNRDFEIFEKMIKTVLAESNSMS
jgi:hypothetical protein